MEIMMSIYFLACYSGALTIKDVWVEIVELFEAKTIEEAKEEFLQVILYLLIIFYQVTGIDFLVPNWLPWHEDYKRFMVWKKLMKDCGLTIDIKWFNCGNNWRRASKIKAVYKNAGYPISEHVANKLLAYAHRIANELKLN